MPHLTPDRDADGREDTDGTLWFTVRTAALFLGKSIQTIYSWERRGHLTRDQAPHDEHGRRIYSQQQLANADRAARLNTARVRRVNAA
ncbi:hypothetical protein ACIPEL_36295 [Streptomyces griseoviridis]